MEEMPFPGQGRDGGKAADFSRPIFRYSFSLGLPEPRPGDGCAALRYNGLGVTNQAENLFSEARERYIAEVWGLRSRWHTRRSLRVLALALLLVCAGYHWAGCGGGKTPRAEEPESAESVAEAPGTEGEGADSGEAVVEGEESFTYQTEGGETTVEVKREPPSEESLGVPVYPGAAYEPGSGGSLSGISSQGEINLVGGEFRTGDPFERVYQWYRERLGEPILYEPAQGMATWKTASGDRDVVVGLRKEDANTLIIIYSMKGDLEP